MYNVRVHKPNIQTKNSQCGIRSCPPNRNDGCLPCFLYKSFFYETKIHTQLNFFLSIFLLSIVNTVKYTKVSSMCRKSIMAELVYCLIWWINVFSSSAQHPISLLQFSTPILSSIPIKFRSMGWKLE